MMVGALATLLFALVARSVALSCDPGYDPECQTPVKLTESSLTAVASPYPSAGSKEASSSDASQKVPGGPKSEESSLSVGSEKKPVGSNSTDSASLDASQKTPMGSNSTESASSDASQQKPTDSKSEVDSISDSSQKEKCEDNIPTDCTFPFTYKGQEYTTCTEVDALDTKWCSADKSYSGSFRQCKSTCHTGKWSVQAIVGTATAGGVAALGIGLTAAAAVLSKREGSAGAAAESRPKTVSVQMNAAPPLQNPATSLDATPATVAAAMPGVEVRSAPVSVPVAAARFLDKPTSNVVPVSVSVPVAAKAAPQTVPTAPTQGNWVGLFGLAILGVVGCCGVCICGIVVAGLRKKHKRSTQRNFFEMEDETQPGYPGAYGENE